MFPSCSRMMAAGSHAAQDAAHHAFRIANLRVDAARGPAHDFQSEHRRSFEHARIREAHRRTKVNGRNSRRIAQWRTASASSRPSVARAKEVRCVAVRVGVVAEQVPFARDACGEFRMCGDVRGRCRRTWLERSRRAAVRATPASSAGRVRHQTSARRVRWELSPSANERAEHPPLWERHAEAHHDREGGCPATMTPSARYD